MTIDLDELESLANAAAKRWWPNKLELAPLAMQP